MPDTATYLQPAPLTARLKAGAAWHPRTLDTLRITDADLRAVLEGRRHLLFDGGMGSMLQAAGLAAGARPEMLNLTDPEAITRVHAAYVEAGAEVITTNTFGANALKLAGDATVAEVFEAAVRCARQAGARYVAGDIGPTGALMHPLGTLSFDDAYALFAEQARAAEAAGADLIIIETMADLAEARAAVLAAKEQTRLPVFCTMTFEADGRTFLGTSPEAAAATLDALGADVVGINCSLGPAEIRPFIQRMLAVCAKPVMVQANAGLPHVEEGRTVYAIEPEAYAADVARMVEDGVAVIGGCCGTTPAFTRLLADIVRDRKPAPRAVAPAFAVAGPQAYLALPAGAGHVAVIGERINPTGKKRLQAALRSGDIDYIVAQGISQQEQGADILDVNVGLPGIDEEQMMQRVSEELQAAITLPLQFDSTDPVAIEAAVRRYPGRALINSVNGSAESLAAVLPVAAHYGSCVVGLTLDEGGIPETAEGRLAIARRIVEAAEKAGVPRERLLIDCLVMTASTNQAQVREILRAVALVKEQLGVATTLGVSNVSFGLPARELLNATFLAAALGAGLDAPIMNPGSARYMDVIRSYRVLNAEDAGSAAFIERYAAAPDPYKLAAGGAAGGRAGGAIGFGGVTVEGGMTPRGPSAGASTTDGTSSPEASAGAVSASPVAGGDTAAQDPAADGAGDDPAAHIGHLVITGRRGETRAAVEELIAQDGADPMAVIDGCLIPALDEVGRLFDAGKLFLPQLMASAEAARAGFDVIRAALPDAADAGKGAVALATVKGDIHDIGKNIVKMLLENYGYTVYDLGRDVAPEEVLACVRAHDVRLAGLSALMTTTVPAMAETIELLHREAPRTKVMVGGAVLTPEYAQQIGADFYVKDAAESARIAEQVLG